MVEESLTNLIWLEQPADKAQPWRLHPIGNIYPDHLVGIVAADIDQDGDSDLMTGAYSWGARDQGRSARRGRAARPPRVVRQSRRPGGKASSTWTRHDVSRRNRGMFDQFVALDLDADGDLDFLTTRGNSEPYDGLLWLEQTRSAEPSASFKAARKTESPEVPLPSPP